MARRDDLFSVSPGAALRPQSLTQAIGGSYGISGNVLKAATKAPEPPELVLSLSNGLVLSLSNGLVEGSKVPPVVDQSIPAAGRALLMTIGQGESNNNYAARFRQKDFSDFSAHPDTYAKITSGPNRGRSSNSAGRYQFISTTWADQARKLGLKDFSPESQDKAAWNLAQETYQGSKLGRGRDLATDLADPARHAAILTALKSQWSSLPGGVEQNQTANTFTSRFSSNLQNATLVAAAPAPAQQEVGSPGQAPGVGQVGDFDTLFGPQNRRTFLTGSASYG